MESRRMLGPNLTSDKSDLVKNVLKASITILVQQLVHSASHCS